MEYWSDYAYQHTKPYYNQAIAYQNEVYTMGIAADVWNSIFSPLLPGQYAKSFAAAIINRLEVIASELFLLDQEQFWAVAADEINLALSEFCSGYGAIPPQDLHEHINTLIQMKVVI